VIYLYFVVPAEKKDLRAHNLAAVWGHCKFLRGEFPSPPQKKMHGINTVLAGSRSKVKWSIAVRKTPHRYGNSRAIWDHTALPATRQRWHSRLYPSRSWYSIKRPRRDARLSWPSKRTHVFCLRFGVSVKPTETATRYFWAGSEPGRRSSYYTVTHTVVVSNWGRGV